MSEAERMESIHVVQPDGTISSAGQALPSLCAEIPAASLLARASSAAAPVAAGTKALYDALSAIRGSLAQMVPQRDPVRRWRGPSPQSSGT